MSVRFIFIVLLLLWSSRAIAQVEFYEEGYILQSGDTVRGFVERNDEVKISKSINFKQALTAEQPAYYLPDAISGLGYYKDGVHFRSVQVEMRRGNNVSMVQRFAKVLLQGYTDLYKVQLQPNEQSVIHRTENTFVYVIRKEEAYYTLGQYEYHEEYGVRLNKRYIGMLKAVLTDCPSSNIKFDKLSFEDKEMVKAVSAYNVCVRPDIPVNHMTYKVKPEVKHGLEVSYGKGIVPGILFTPSNHIVGLGYFWDILRPDISRNKSIRLGLNFNYNNFNMIPSNVVESNSQYSLLVPLLAQFNVAKEENSAIAPFFSLGMSAQLLATSQMDNAGIYTLITLGAGMYMNNYRFSFTLDSDNLLPISVKFLNLAVGYRFDSSGK